jgi:hypothetical protein
VAGGGRGEGWGVVMSHRQCLVGGPNDGCNIAAVSTIPNDGSEWLAYGVGSTIVVLFSQEEDQEKNGIDSKRNWSLWQILKSERKKSVVDDDVVEEDFCVTSVAWMQGRNHVLSPREGVGRFPLLISATSRFIDIFYPSLSVTVGSISDVGNRNLPCFEWVASYDAWQLPSREDNSFFSTLDPLNDLSRSTVGLLQRVACSVWDLPVACFNRKFKSSTAELRSEATDQSQSSTRFIVASARRDHHVHIWTVPPDTLLSRPSSSTTEFRLVHVFEYHLPFEDHIPCQNQRKLQSAQEGCSVLLACLDGGVPMSMTPNVLFATASPNSKIVWVCNVLMSEIDASSPPLLFEEKLVHPCRVQSFQWKPPCPAAQTSEIVVRMLSSQFTLL